MPTKNSFVKKKTPEKCPFNNRGFCKEKQDCNNRHSENVCDDFECDEVKCNLDPGANCTRKIKLKSSEDPFLSNSLLNQHIMIYDIQSHQFINHYLSLLIFTHKIVNVKRCYNTFSWNKTSHSIKYETRQDE